MRVLLLSGLICLSPLYPPQPLIHPVSSGPVEVPRHSSATAAPMPPARGPLSLGELDRGDGPPTLLALGEAVATITGQDLYVSEATRQVLANIPLVSIGTREVPAEEVYPFFEAVLLREAVLLTCSGTPSAPLFGLHLANAPHPMLGFEAYRVDASELGRLEDHPALLVQTLFETGSTPARELVASLSATIARVPACSLIAAGGHTLLVTGPVRWVRTIEAVLDHPGTREEEPGSGTR